MGEKSGTISEQKDARVLHAFGEEITILLDGERTDGKLTMWTEITPPGGGRPRITTQSKTKRFTFSKDELHF